MALKIHLALFHFLAQSPQLHSIWHLCLHGNHHKHNVWLHTRWKLATAEGEASWLLWALHSKPAGVWKKEREAKKETWMWVGQVPPLPDLPLFFLRPPGIFLRGLEKAPAAFVLQLVVLSCGTCSRRDLPEVQTRHGASWGPRRAGIEWWWPFYLWKPTCPTGAFLLCCDLRFGQVFELILIWEVCEVGSLSLGIDTGNQTELAHFWDHSYRAGLQKASWFSVVI